MKKPKDKIFRKFLNKKGYQKTASVMASVEYDKNYSWITLVISDCRKTIEIDLSGRSKADISNTKYKLKTLREAIKHLENNIDECIAWDKFNSNKK